MSSSSAHSTAPSGPALIALYDASMEEVYGYFVRRCGSPATAEDLTSETFLAAADAIERGTVQSLTVQWLIGVARNKLVDHWRRRERDEKTVVAVASAPIVSDDPWDVHLDLLTAHRVLERLLAQHRAALVLRYLDGLPVRDVANALGRTEGATEVLLVRARRAFRDEYEAIDGDGPTDEQTGAKR